MVASIALAFVKPSLSDIILYLVLFFMRALSISGSKIIGGLWSFMCFLIKEIVWVP